MRIVVLGSGESARTSIRGMADDVPIAAISSGYMVAPREPELWFGLDAPKHFPASLIESTVTSKHVNSGDAERWSDVPNVTVWEHVTGPRPFFEEPNAAMAGHIYWGWDCKSNSLTFSVQIIPRLGYKTLFFAGVDLLEFRWPICEMLRLWYPVAQKSGCEWFNLSPSSALSAWMPAATIEECNQWKSDGCETLAATASET